MCDIGADRPLSGYAHYSVSKAGLVMLVKAMAVELAPEVRTVGVSPGQVMWPDDYDDKKRARLARRIPMGRAGTPAEVGRDYKAKGQGWIIVGDENYGEGSSREHAAMEPRHLGCKAVLVRSFARIHETNLKKQGVLPLTFVDPADYDRFREDDRIAIKGLADLAPGSRHEMVLTHADGTTESFLTQHSMPANQIGWFQAGSALNLIASKQG